MPQDSNISFTTPQDNANSSNQIKAPDSQGSITKSIGTGENAKNSFVFLTLKWSFYSGVIITILVVINCWLFRVGDKVPDFMGDIKTTWSIITPIITLALGYAFGKSRE